LQVLELPEVDAMPWHRARFTALRAPHQLTSAYQVSILSLHALDLCHGTSGVSATDRALHAVARARVAVAPVLRGLSGAFSVHQRGSNCRSESSLIGPLVATWRLLLPLLGWPTTYGAPRTKLDLSNNPELWNLEPLLLRLPALCRCARRCRRNLSTRTSRCMFQSPKLSLRNILWPEIQRLLPLTSTQADPEGCLS